MGTRKFTLTEHVAEPANLWIRHTLSGWPAVAGDVLWCDLAAGGLGRVSGGSAGTPSALPPGAAAVAAERAAGQVRRASDVVLVPPLPPGHESLRASVVAAAAAAGVPLLVQAVGELPPVPGLDCRAAPDVAAVCCELPGNAVVVVDVLDSLVRGAAALRPDAASRSPQRSLAFERSELAGATVVWPLVAGWTDQAVVLDAGLGRLVEAGARRVVSRALELTAEDRRRLAERLEPAWPGAFDVLFHGEGASPDADAFRDAASAAGVNTRLPRPLPRPPLPPRLRTARALAGRLIELGDATSSDAEAETFYRAARFLDRGEVDIEATAREGNLGVLSWLLPPAREAAEAWLAERQRRPGR